MKRCKYVFFLLFLMFILVACDKKSSTHNSRDMQIFSDEKEDISEISSSRSEDSHIERNCSLSKEDVGKSYSFMSDRWDLYIAEILSESTIKIEKWGRFTADKKTAFEFEYDFCIIKPDDVNSDFEWIDNEHTTFSISMNDPDNSYLVNCVNVYFTIDKDNAITLGSNVTKKESYYAYTFDRWNMYKAVCLSDNLIKIENWGRFTADDKTPFLYSYDVGVVDVLSDNNDFEWIDDEHNGFIVTMRDSENSDWEKSCLTCFTVEKE